MGTKIHADRVIWNVGQLLTMNPSQPGSEAGLPGQAGLGIVTRAALAFKGDRLVWIGKDRDLAGSVEGPAAEPQTLDAGGRVALPGLVDCHTHLVFAGSRPQEFAGRLAGSSYEEILAAGGGIHSTVAATRTASEEQLAALGRRRLRLFLEHGVTTLEAKSGYGLDTASELKILRVAKALKREQPVEIVSTFLGAHTVPREYSKDRDTYLDLLIGEMLPGGVGGVLRRVLRTGRLHARGGTAHPRARLEIGHGPQAARRTAQPLRID